MTLLQMPPSAAACVLELGMSHLGEIALLADICQPTVQSLSPHPRRGQQCSGLLKAEVGPVGPSAAGEGDYQHWRSTHGRGWRHRGRRACERARAPPSP